MLKFSILLILTVSVSTCLFGQGEIDEQEKIFYRNEKSYGLLINSNGWGVNYRYGKRLDGYNKALYEIDFVGMRHPKEIKTTNPYSLTARRYVFGKLNAFINIRGGVGKQKEVYRKIDKGGISIRYFYLAGASVGILKPIYYEIYDYVTADTKDEKFDPDKHRVGAINGRASIFLGMTEIKLTPGAFVKIGTSFEYSKLDVRLKALEAGAVFEAFLLEPTIMASGDNSRFFISLFVSYRFGKIFDPKAKNDEEKIIN